MCKIGYTKSPDKPTIYNTFLILYGTLKIFASILFNRQFNKE